MVLWFLLIIIKILLNNFIFKLLFLIQIICKKFYTFKYVIIIINKYNYIKLMNIKFVISY